jgi:hypothetical protein
MKQVRDDQRADISRSITVNLRRTHQIEIALALLPRAGVVLLHLFPR